MRCITSRKLQQNQKSTANIVRYLGKDFLHARSPFKTEQAKGHETLGKNRTIEDIEKPQHLKPIIFQGR